MRRLLVVLTVFLTGECLHAQVADPLLWAPNGPVNAVLLKDSLLYVGGDFTQVSPVTGHFTLLDSSTAAVVPGYPLIGGRVDCMAKDSLGRVYVGGLFDKVGSHLCNNLFRLTPQGTFDSTFLPDPNGEVFTIYLHDSTVFVAGDFTIIDGFYRGRAAAFDTSDVLTPFDPQSNGPIYALCADFLGKLVVGGNFDHIGGADLAYICRVKPETGAAVLFGNSFWTAIPQIGGPVRAIRTRGTDIYVAGDFNGFASVTRRGLAVIDLGTAGVENLNANINGWVRDIELVDSTIYLGGNFSIVDGNGRNNLAAIDLNFHAKPWNPSVNGPVYDLQLWDTTAICVGGNFITAGTDTSYYAALVDLDTLGTVHSWNAKLDNAVYAMMPAHSPGKVWTGGDFAGAGGILCRNFVALNVNTRRPIAWQPKVNAPVTTLCSDSTHLFLAGNFSMIDGQTRNGLASLDLNNQSITPFNPGVNGLVRTMTVAHSQLFLGGNFTIAGGQPRNNIAAIDLSTSLANNWNPGCAGTVNKIIVDGDNMYVAGFFTQTGGQFRNNLARLSTTSSLADWSWSSDTDDGIYDIELYNGQLYAGGWFKHVQGQARDYLAAVDTASGNLLAFNPACDDFVRGFVRWNDDLFISGHFISVGSNMLRPNLCNYDLGDAAFDNWNPIPDAFPVTMQVSQDWLFIGGSFTYAGYRFHPNLAMINVNYVTGVPENSFTPGILHVWPNPAGDFVHFSLPENFNRNSTLSVIDVNGKTVQEEKIRNAANNYTINLSGLLPGLYTIRLVDEKGNSLTSRVIKQ